MAALVESRAQSRESGPLSLWERGWGEGPAAFPMAVHHAAPLTLTLSPCQGERGSDLAPSPLSAGT